MVEDHHHRHPIKATLSRTCMGLGLVPVLAPVRDLVVMVLEEEVDLRLEDVVVRVQAQCAVLPVLHEVDIPLRDLVVAIPLLVEVDLVLLIAHLLWILTVSCWKALRIQIQIHSTVWN